MAFPYKNVLLIGATAGIGAALADKFILEGAHVIAVGRRQERLDAFVEKHGSDRASAIRCDMTDRAGLDEFVSRVNTSFPNLDCVFLNAGTQSPVRLSRPSEVDLDAFHQEINTNFTSVVNLAVKFSAVLLEKSCATALIVTGTHLSLVPAVHLPAYSSSKAALTAFIDCLRRQNQGKNCKFIEVAPPVVQTELHDYMGEERGRSMGMPVDEFVRQCYPQLVSGAEDVSVGLPVGVTADEFQSFKSTRKTMFEKLADVVLAHFEL